MGPKKLVNELKLHRIPYRSSPRVLRCLLQRLVGHHTVRGTDITCHSLSLLVSYPFSVSRRKFVLRRDTSRARDSDHHCLIITFCLLACSPPLLTFKVKRAVNSNYPPIAKERKGEKKGKYASHVHTHTQHPFPLHLHLRPLNPHASHCRTTITITITRIHLRPFFPPSLRFKSLHKRLLGRLHRVS